MNIVDSFYAPDKESWRTWLEKNHDKESGVWLVFDKGKHRTMSWQDIVEEALCFGWIDGKAGKVSETQSKIYVSRRKPKSVWSKINKQNIKRLIDEKRMQSAGMKSVEIAKLNGSWNALDLSDNLIILSELLSLFKINITAQNNFNNFSASVRKNTLQWIYDAKTELTKMNRIKQTFEAAKSNTLLR